MEKFRSSEKIEKLRDLIGCLNESGITSQNYKKEIFMDKKIAKVKQQNDKKMDKLISEDKVRDKKMEKCDMKMKKKK